VLGTYPDGVSLASAFLAARQLGLPFYAHMHDLWVENTQSGTALARFAETWEPLILRRATRVLCMTEAMQEHYAKKYGIKTYFLPHSIPEEDYRKAPGQPHAPRLPKPTVLFVGAVSPEMNLDALKVLAAASELLPVEYDLLFCTSVDLALLQRFGIRSSRLRATYVSRAEVQRLQSEAHVLVAVLSHKNGSPHEVQTVFSTKLLEYLVAGRPIVVFAPPGSYHAESARRNGWGHVVTEDSPAALAAGLLTVAKDEKLAARLVAGARREAEARRAIHHTVRLREWVLSDARYATGQIRRTLEGALASGH
jgi:glycosyltransferase involved in cell wall biosynthesis